MTDSWDDDNFDPLANVQKASWEDAVTKNEPAKQTPAVVAPSATKVEPAKAPAPAPASTAAKAAKKARKEILAKKDQEIPSDQPLPDPVLEKQRKQRIVEENAHEMFGSLSKAGELDKFIPKSKEDFLEFAALLAQRGTAYSSNLHYTEFVKEVVKRLVAPQRSDDVKAVSASLTAIINEKLKEEKGPTKAKKNTTVGAAKKVQNRQDTLIEDEAGFVDDEVEFM